MIRFRPLFSLFALLLVPTLAPAAQLLPGMPPILNPHNIYSAAGANMLSPVVKNDKPLVYVPNTLDGTVSVIDPATYKVIATYPTGALPQHVVPSYDLRTLWVTNDYGNSLTPFNPLTGKPGKNVPVRDPYNMYFTPDGRYAIVVAEQMERLDFRNPHTMKLHDSLKTRCKGIDHLDFTADGRFLIASCEFSGDLVKVNVETHKVVGYLKLKSPQPHVRPMPQDVRVDPEGNVFFVADMNSGGVELIDPVTFKQIGFIATGTGAHGIYPSRDGRYMYVTDRGNPKVWGPHRGDVAVIDPVARKVVAHWAIPGGGSPDMGNVNAAGTELWLSGRYDNVVYVFDTQTGKLLHKIKVGRQPHGLTVWPQPGRYSLGHTGNIR
ncbi:MAG: hypothetical protein WCB49_13800 [Gammaproteobacteria bacterium]